MKRIIFSIVLIFAFVGLVNAEGLKLSFYGGAGIGLPKKPDNLVPNVDIGLTDMYKSAVNFGAGIGIPLNSQFELVGRFRSSVFAFDGEGFSDKLNEQFNPIMNVTGLATLDIEVAGADVKVIEFLAEVKFMIPTGDKSSSFHPYLIGGLGMAKATLGEWTVDIEATIPILPPTTFVSTFDEISETKQGVQYWSWV